MFFLLIFAAILCKICAEYFILIRVVVCPYDSVSVTLVKAIRTRGIGEKAVGDDEVRGLVFNSQGVPETHELVVEEAAIGDRIVGTADPISDRSRVGEASVEYVDSGVDFKGYGIDEHFGDTVGENLGIGLVGILIRQQQLFVATVKFRPLTHGFSLRRYRAAPDVATGEAIGAAVCLESRGIVDDEAVRIMAVVLVGVDTE